MHRTSSNYRDYPESLINEVKLLRSMQSLGFSLTEIRQVLEGLRARDIDCADRAHLLNDKRASRRTNQRSERSQANSAAGTEALRGQRASARKAARAGDTPERLCAPRQNCHSDVLGVEWPGRPVTWTSAKLAE